MLTTIGKLIFFALLVMAFVHIDYNNHINVEIPAKQILDGMKITFQKNLENLEKLQTFIQNELQNN